MDEEAFVKEERGNSGSKSSQRIFPEIVIKGIRKASLKLKDMKFTIRTSRRYNGITKTMCRAKVFID